eukprot:CAMPEP_0118903836 /NCGR_PEP_ID=MMETSP1166-20130328/8548_1 /TAXON_ID=1104430 /ORGANISM="Chrysoreinhardia sp, Strain CCMP3193" /LENGTH=405 /DNA_ID=CAMNT_0006843073 /DNA_START=14 /DNA_END=1228 /DNA_ORIENTATION=+
MATFFSSSARLSRRKEEDEEKTVGGGDDDDGLERIALLIDRLKDDDVDLRTESNAKLAKIAKALGPERTRDELVPFLCESVDDADEVLAAMAKSLGELGSLVSGGPRPLLEPLEALAAIEESSVRDEAVESATKIAKDLSVEDAEKYYLPFASRLATHEWFTGRTSACGLVAPLLHKPRVSDATKREAAKLFARLCADDTPMVRRVAATELAKFAKALANSSPPPGPTGGGQGDDDDDDPKNDPLLEKTTTSKRKPPPGSTTTTTTSNNGKVEASASAAPGTSSGTSSPPPPSGSTTSWSPLSKSWSEVVSLFRSLADDEQDSVRLQTAPNCVALAKAWAKSPATQRAVVLPALIGAGADRSWRVRWSAAVAVDATMRYLDDASSKRDAVAAFVDLLNDVEVEVR